MSAGPEPTQLAAAYAKALIRAHPFADGTKRSGFLVAVVFWVFTVFASTPPMKTWC